MADITSNLEAHWKLDDNSTAAAVDSSGGGHTQTLVNTPTPATGKVGSYCLSFASASSERGSAATWAGVQGTGAKTFACWVKTTGTSCAIASWGEDAIGKSWRINLESGSVWLLAGSNTVSWGANCNDGQWHHIAVVKLANGTVSTTECYLDGVLKARVAPTGTTTLDIGGGNPVYLAYDWKLTAGYLEGSLDDVRIYSRALAAADVLELFLLGKATINDPLAWWKLDETSGTSAADSSGNGYSGTYARDASNTTTAGVAGTAYDADGSNDKIALPTGIISGATAITIACHFRPTLDATANRGVFGFGQEGNRQMWLYYQPDGSFAVHGSTSGTNDIVLSPGPGTLVNASDHHICVTWDGSLAKLYLNRAVISTDTSLGAAIKAGDTISQIGRIGTYERAKGRIDDVRIYNRALDAREVYALCQYTGSTRRAGWCPWATGFAA